MKSSPRKKLLRETENNRRTEEKQPFFFLFRKTLQGDLRGDFEGHLSFVVLRRRRRCNTLVGVSIAILSSHRGAVERRERVGIVIHGILLRALDGARILVLRLHHRNLSRGVVDETGICDVAGRLLA